MICLSYYISPKGEDAMTKLVGQGFTFPEEPKDEPVLPEDLSALGGEDLISLFALLTAWADYAEAQEGFAVISEREAEREVERAQAEFWQTVPPKTTVAAAKAMQVLSQDIVDAQDRLDDCYAYRKLVGDLARKYERDAAMVSRELTRRSNDAFTQRSSRRERWKP